MQKNVTVCDVCSKTKGETNHWWQAKRSGPLLLVATQESGTIGHPDADLCGNQCVHTYVSQAMENIAEEERTARASPTVA